MSSWVMDRAPNPQTVALFGRRGSLLQTVAGQVPRFGHTQRTEDLFLRELMEVLPGYLSNDLAQYDTTDVRGDKL